MALSLLQSTSLLARKSASSVASRHVNVAPPRRMASFLLSPNYASSTRVGTYCFPRTFDSILCSTSTSRPLGWRKQVVLRFFQTESAFHKAADETLEDIQDAIDVALEEKGIPDFEVTVASGVLTLVFPPHGTWVINKQTPNQQLWWSSPMSGPRRYEYEDGDWVYTRDDAHSMTLTQALQEEIRQIYDVEIDL